MRFTRWWNPSLPQTLQIAVWLLYADAVFALLSVMGFPIGGSAYSFIYFLISDAPVVSDSLDSINTIGTLVVLVSTLAYGFAGLGIANSQKIGWKVGVAVAVGAVIIPLLAGGLDLVLSPRYLITYLFNIALVALLVHPQSREYQRIWFDGPAPRGRR